MSRLINIKGQRFDRWLVLEKVKQECGESRWICQCDCGTIREVTQISLRRGTSKSCGCLNRDVSRCMCGENSVHWKGGKTRKECLICKTHFYAYTGVKEEQIYCSRRCSDIGKMDIDDSLKNKNTPKRIVVKCSHCNAEIKITHRESDLFATHFCDRKCAGKWKSENNIGENSANWKGGITPKRISIRESTKYKQWRLAIYERDDYTCQCCGNNIGNINAHHIENFANLYNEVDEIIFNHDNGITLCKDCHEEFHSVFGRKDNNENQLWNFIANQEIKHQL